MAKLLLIFFGWLAMRGQLVEVLGLATGAVNAQAASVTQQTNEQAPIDNAKP